MCVCVCPRDDTARPFFQSPSRIRHESSFIQFKKAGPGEGSLSQCEKVSSTGLCTHKHTHSHIQKETTLKAPITGVPFPVWSGPLVSQFMMHSLACLFYFYRFLDDDDDDDDGDDEGPGPASRSVLHTGGPPGEWHPVAAREVCVCVVRDK